VRATVTYRYAEANASPGSGELSFDVADQTVAATLVVNATSSVGDDLAGLWASLVAGNTVELDDPASGVVEQHYRVTGAPVAAPPLVSIPVKWEYGGAAVVVDALVLVVLDAQHVPSLAPPPDADAVATYLSLTAAQRTSDVEAMLTEDVATALDYELTRADYGLLEADGATPPSMLPTAFVHAVTMRAAATYRRRNSINGFDGYQDLGTVPVRATDPDIERLVDRWRAWAWA
jgi:hypothetical protein